jgi:hypothetical protein
MEGELQMKVKKGDYLIVETSINNDTEIKDADVLPTPFASVSKALADVINGALETVDHSSLTLVDGKDKTWGSNYFIVQVVKIVRPVPVAKIEMEIMEVK